MSIHICKAEIAESIAEETIVSVDGVKVSSLPEEKDDALDKLKDEVTGIFREKFGASETEAECVGNLVFVFYTGEKKADGGEVEEYFRNTGYSLVPVFLSFLPENEIGKTDTAALKSAALRAAGEVRRKFGFYRNNLNVVSARLEQTLKNEIEYYSFNQIVELEMASVFESPKRSMLKDPV